MRAEDYWVRELRRLRDSTRWGYRHFMGGFLGWAGLSLEELYELHRGYVMDGDPRSNRNVPCLVSDYVNFLVRVDGYSGGHGRNIAAAVRHFFSANSLPFPLRSSDLPRVVTRGVRVISKGEIRRWMELCVGTWYEKRNKALTMVSKDLGFRASDVSRLNVEDVLGARVIREGDDVFRIFESFNKT